ncbi:hypothetical protein LXL04_020362 [Taraxacum kok-saghyz]
MVDGGGRYGVVQWLVRLGEKACDGWGWREHACRDAKGLGHNLSEMCGTRAMRRRQFYSANGFVSGNRAITNFFSKRRLVVYPHNVALTPYFRLMVSSPKNDKKIHLFVFVSANHTTNNFFGCGGGIGVDFGLGLSLLGALTATKQSVITTIKASRKQKVCYASLLEIWIEILCTSEPKLMDRAAAVRQRWWLEAKRGAFDCFFKR